MILLTNLFLTLVIVIGETARTAIFSLGGYARPTNPELAGMSFFFNNVEA